jgi:hypothetical protein
MVQQRLGNAPGLDTDGGFAVVLMPDSAGPLPVPVLLVPVTDYRQFIEGLRTDDDHEGVTPVRLAGTDAIAGSKGKYAVITKRGNRDVLDRVLNARDSGDRLAGGWESWLVEADVALVVTQPGVQALCRGAEVGLQQAAKGLEAMPADAVADMEAAVAMLRLYQKLPGFLAQEVVQYGAALTIDAQQSLQLTERVRLVPNGKAVELTREAKPPAAGLLAGLPARPLVGVVSGVTTEGLSNLMLNMSMSIMRAVPSIYGLNDEQLTEMEKITAQSMQGIRGMSMMMCHGQSDKPLFASFIALITVDDAREYLGRYQQMLAAMNQLTKEAESSILSRMDFEHVELAGCPGLSVTTKLPVHPRVKDQAEYKKSMELMFGKDGQMSFFLAAADQHTLVLSYVTPDLLLQAVPVVQGSTRGLADDPVLAATAKLLPDDAPWGVYVSPRGAVDLVKQLAALAGAEDADSRIPEFPESPPVGFAVTVQPDGLQSKTVIPEATVKAIGQYVMQQLGKEVNQ